MNTHRKRGILHIGRYGEILSIFIKYGFRDIVSMIRHHSNLPLKFFKKEMFDTSLTRWERIRFVLEELGPTFIKFGQFMSNRPDILPPALIEELEKLQDSVKSFSYDELHTILEIELFKESDTIFKEFSKTPVASASIAQVHKAVLQTGEIVAVKVQRPNISRRVKIDLDILYHAVNLIQRQNESIRRLQLMQLVYEFEHTILKELNFSIEASHIKRFQRLFSKEKQLYIPKVYEKFTTKRVLVTEFIEGYKITDINKLEKMGIDKKLIAQRGAELIMKQIFHHGIFHADPHPGNILIRPDGSICFLDFGAVGIITPTLRYNLGVLLFGVVHKDFQRIIKTLSFLSNQPIVNGDDLEYEMMELIEEYSYSPLREINIGEVLQRFSSIIIRHNLRIVPGFYLLLKAIVTIEGVGCKLDPDFNLTNYLEPFVRKMILIHPRMRYLPFDIYFTINDCIMLLKDLPFDIQEIIRTLRLGRLQIQFQHKGLEPLMSKLEQLATRLIFSIVLASLIIGSSIVVHANIPPHFYDISVIGIVGYLMAGIIGFGLIFLILRRGKI